MTTGAAAPALPAAPADRRRARDVQRDRDGQTGAFLQLAVALLWIPQAWLLAQAIGTLTQGGDVAAVALRAAIGVLALGLVRAALDLAGARLCFAAARRGLTQLRARAVAALAARSPLDAGRPASGTAASLLAEQAEAVVPYLARYRPVQLRVVAVPLVLLAVVAYEAWLAALVLLLAAPLIPFFMALVGWRAQAASAEQMVEMGQMNGFLLDRLRGLATIRAFDAVDLVARRLRESADTLRRKTMAVLRIAFLSSAVLELFSALGVAMVAVYVGFHLLGSIPFGAWGARLTLAQGMFVLLLAPAFFEPLRDLAAVWHDRASGVAALEALQRLGADGPALVGGSGARAATAVPAGPLALEFDALRFRYPGAGADVFGNFSLRVAAGERVALVAASGAGKSTLLALAAGLVAAGAGTVRIGGVVLTAASADALRARMAWIGQPPHIFAGTLAYNIALGRPGVGPAAVAAAARGAALSGGKLARLDQPLGEGGTGLSGGEVLRLAIARAAAAPGIGLLLADEPTAHLDAETADAVTTELLALAARGATLVVATHDARLAARMGRVVDLAAVRLRAAT